jgi:hypothetical protein
MRYVATGSPQTTEVEEQTVATMVAAKTVASVPATAITSVAENTRQNTQVEESKVCHVWLLVVPINFTPSTHPYFDLIL